MSGSARLALFDTALGVCSIAWYDTRLVATHMPAASPEVAREALAAQISGARQAYPPLTTKKAMADIALNESGRYTLCAKVYTLASAIRPGETRTYCGLAKDLGDKCLAQPVGQALGANL